MKSPKLYFMGAKNVLHQWEAWNVGSVIYTRHGQVHGKLQTSVGKRCLPKNVGRANETTAIQQADLEVKAMIAHKLKIKYAVTPEKAAEPRFLPMLAHNFKKHHNPVTYPVLVQRKYDGFRCLASKEDGVVTLSSREGEVFDLPHIAKELEQYIPDGYMLDGELYAHGVLFQRIASWIKRNQPESQNLKYIVYDVPEAEGRDDLEMKDRYALLGILFKHDWKFISIAPTHLAHSKEEVLDYEVQFVTEGYEGAIVRTTDGKYRFDHRSYSLLKVKSFEDAEFLVVGGKAGKGKDATTAVFELALDPKNPNGRRFHARPMGKLAVREEYLKNLKKYVGQMLTVKFQGRSIDGVPRFPVGKGFRPQFDKKAPNVKIKTPKPKAAFV